MTRRGGRAWKAERRVKKGKDTRVETRLTLDEKLVTGTLHAWRSEELRRLEEVMQALLNPSDYKVIKESIGGTYHCQQEQLYCST